MKHDFETFPEKMFRLFGEKKFKPGSFKFEFMTRLYDIVSTDEKGIHYGDDGFFLTAEDFTQFIVTEVRIRNRISDSVVIKILERNQYIDPRGVL